jgi:hypothetical protein
MGNFPLFYLIPGLGPALIVAAWICVAIIHVAFAVGVLKDSYRMLHIQRNNTFLVGGSIWALATLFGGVITVGIYWAIHHSALRPTPPVPEKQL